MSPDKATSFAFILLFVAFIGGGVTLAMRAATTEPQCIEKVLIEGHSGSPWTAAENRCHHGLHRLAREHESWVCRCVSPPTTGDEKEGGE